MKKVILMLVDALSSEYLTKENMPHLYAYAQENVHVQEINPNFGFCERTEVFTGMKPRNSGNFTAIGYNPEKGMYRKETLLLRLFSYAEKVSYINARRGLNLYARFAGKRMRPYLIPLNMLNKFFLTEDEKNHEEVNAFVGESVFDVMTERDLKYTLEAFTALGRESRLKNDRERLDCVIRLLNKEYSFIPLYISAADAMGHICREDALGMQNMLKQVDGYVKELIDLTAENEDVTLMILGDHGMELVGEYVDIQKTLLNSGLKEQKDYDYFLDSTIARFWSSDKKVLETIVQIINAEWRDMGFWMTEELARKYQIPYGKTFGREYGDIMWCANAGVLIFPDFFNKKEDTGMHGYANPTKSGKGLLVYSGEKREISSGELVDVCATLCDLLEIRYPNKCSGHSFEQDLRY